ncbi:MAG: hybrid sensor histidine kinase/response regulator [Magnetococcales bacterium]|nr:hybrid sensor histidine kinase/response regulator [Magnetococcales bacterium]
MNEQELLDKLQEAFRIESRERLTTIGRELVELEKEQTPEQRQESLERIYRDAHSLKGAARAVNLKEIETLCQAMEGVMGALKKGAIPFSPSLFDAIYRTVSAVERVMESPPGGPSPLGKKALSLLVQGLTDLHKPETAPTFMDGGNLPPPSKVKSGDASILVTTNPVVIDPPLVDPPPVSRVPLPVAQPDCSPPADQNQPTNPVSVAIQAPMMSNTVRLSIDKLDQLLLRSVELITLKLAGHQHLAELKQTEQTFDLWRQKWGIVNPFWRSLRRWAAQLAGGDGLDRQASQGDVQEVEKFLTWNQEYVRTQNRDIKTLTRRMDQHQRILDRMVDEMIASVKQLLMLPSSSLLDLFPRMVRDIAHAQNKEVDLLLGGGEVEVDRRILEEMKDPLTHMLRNAIDHGLELPAERLRLGKSRRGTIRLGIVQVESDKVEVRIEDDGRGIDVVRIRESAIRGGLISREDAKVLSERQMLDLIFLSGVSSSEIITDLSGRGLGMAIVRERVEKLGGNLEMENRPGEGMTLRILLPISLATFRGVLVRSARHLFIIPSTQMESVLQLPRDGIRMLENRATINCKGTPLSLVDLSHVLGIAEAASETGHQKNIVVVVLAMGEKRVGFRVDDLLGEQEVLVKSLGSQLQHVRHLAGATILGSGGVVPILNVRELLVSATEMSGRVQRVSEFLSPPRAEVVRKSILVVEDSLTSRILLKNILDAAGYMVQTAVDGLDGLTFLKTSDVDLVVTDVEMPRMNGFELTEKIRADATLSHLPVILVTTLSSREDRERGIASGANAYIVKGNFEQGNLLEIVARLA